MRRILKKNLERFTSCYRKFKIDENLKKHDSDIARRRFWWSKLPTARKIQRKFRTIRRSFRELTSSIIQHSPQFNSCFCKFLYFTWKLLFCMAGHLFQVIQIISDVIIVILEFLIRFFISLNCDFKMYFYNLLLLNIIFNFIIMFIWPSLSIIFNFIVIFIWSISIIVELLHLHSNFYEGTSR